ncbi:Ig-like domain-containing protein [Sphingobium chlorophenolicum]|uniref:Large repetitive protein n=1 Tax=Sphingobium chlorophenolicum TaxID=46429 RepID=A0A081RDY0_SPHCR|nr:Ig-like domain-containing protein [Sphingobium chlorophenolicum]KEQ53403.1 Large repetitive protein [Sphingobium chlorophenolicum]
MQLSAKVASETKQLQTVKTRIISDKIAISPGEHVALDISRNMVDNYSREGSDLVIHLKDGQTLRIEHYYGSLDKSSHLYLLDDYQQLVAVDLTPAAGGALLPGYTPLGIAAEFAAAGGSGGLGTAGILGGLLLGGGAIAAAAGGGGGGNRSPNGGGQNPTQPTPDTTAPAAASNLAINAAGTTLTGAAEAGATVRIDVNGDGTPDYSATADANGRFSVTLNPPLVNDENVSVTVRDAAGNTSPPASVHAPDLTPPQPATGVTVSPDGTSVTGQAEPGATVSVDTDGDGIPDASATAGDNGNFTVPLSPPLIDSETVSVVVTDPGGNHSTPVTAVAPDLTAPPAPLLDLSNGAQISGTAEPGSTVTISTGGVALGQTTADGAGDWTFTPTSPLPDGTVVTATATDAAGNTGPQASTTVDALPPALTIDSGTVASGGSTNDTTPTISGSGAPANGTVTILDNGIAVGTATADGAGAWTFTSAALTDGTTHAFTAQATDAAGNTGTSGAYTISIDTTAPALTIDTGTVASGSSTNDTTPTINGSGAPANGTVTILDNGVAVGTATADGAGAWTFTSPTLTDGTTHAFTAQATDAAGNTGTSGAYTISIDTTSPAITIDTGTVASGGSTNDTTPTINGSGAPANSTVTILDNGIAVGTATADGAGAWSFTSPALTDGTTHAFTAEATDAAGNTGTSSAYTISIDTTAPALTIDTGTVASGSSTNDTTPAISGSGAPANGTVTILDNGVAVGTATADGAGAWTFTSPTLTDGTTHAFTAEATDAAGNTGTSGAYTIAIDTTPPAVTIDTGTVASGSSTNDTTPTISGSGAPANSTVTILDNGIAVGTATADGAGAWTFTSPALTDGTTHAFTVQATDAAGNTGTSSAYTISIDTTPPTVAITGASDNFAPITGPLADGSSTNDTTPTIDGTGPANSTVTILDNGIAVGTATSDGTSAWSFTSPALTDGTTHAFTAQATDAAGNTGTSSAYTISIDTTAPTQTVNVTSIADDTETAGDFITQDTSPTILGTLSATLDAGDAVQISLDGGTTWTDATVDGTSWFFGPGNLATGSYTADVRVVDAAGNIGNTDSQAFQITAPTAHNPLVVDNSSGLLGLVSAEALGILTIGGGNRIVTDVDNNLSQVVFRYEALVAVGATLQYSSALAAELGLQVVSSTSGILGLIGYTSTLTITPATGTTMDNLAVNELLNTIHFDTVLSGLGGGLLAAVLAGTTITATDSTGLIGSANAGALVDASVLNFAANSTVVEGTGGSDTLNANSAAGSQIYGHGGDDTLNGGAGNDLLRGGAGADTLHGGAGSDVLIYDAADDVAGHFIDGGTGAGTDGSAIDTLLLGAGINLTIDANTHIQNIERVDLGAGNGANSLTLTADGVLAATEAAHTLTIAGGSADTVTMLGAQITGQQLVDGHAYNVYTFGANTILVEDAVLVAA